MRPSDHHRAGSGRVVSCRQPVHYHRKGEINMKRRQFITLLGGAAAWPLMARAQQSERVPRVGVLIAIADGAEGQARLDAFKNGMRDLGWAARRRAWWATFSPRAAASHRARRDGAPSSGNRVGGEQTWIGRPLCCLQKIFDHRHKPGGSSCYLRMVGSGEHGQLCVR